MYRYCTAPRAFQRRTYVGSRSASLSPTSFSYAQRLLGYRGCKVKVLCFPSAAREARRAVSPKQACEGRLRQQTTCLAASPVPRHLPCAAGKRLCLTAFYRTVLVLYSSPSAGKLSAWLALLTYAPRTHKTPGPYAAAQKPALLIPCRAHRTRPCLGACPRVHHRPCCNWASSSSSSSRPQLPVCLA